MFAYPVVNLGRYWSSGYIFHPDQFIHHRLKILGRAEHERVETHATLEMVLVRRAEQPFLPALERLEGLMVSGMLLDILSDVVFIRYVVCLSDFQSHVLLMSFRVQHPAHDWTTLRTAFLGKIAKKKPLKVPHLHLLENRNSN